MKKSILFFICTIMVSCSFEHRDRIPSISPEYIELSNSKMEADFYVPDNQAMYSFTVGNGKSYNIPKSTKENRITLNVNGKYNTILYFKNSKLKSIEFPFLEVINNNNGKYKLVLKEQTKIRLTLSFLYPGGGSNIIINIK